MRDHPNRPAARQDRLYRRHAPAVQGYVARRLGPQAAEDVVAETFMAAFRARGRYDTSREEARAWLSGIATREIAARKRVERSWYRKVEVACPDPPVSCSAV
ncbi:RNA polymerase sigma factor [Nonomuraea lactucae]|uniref:RNA polymerase sigma factor n=1 Tax=Nonomuraea lactucae TaxID=2249762 RepID=UPI000DE3A491|nr:sigma factor [Nonomuraea lactucae]